MSSIKTSVTVLCQDIGDAIGLFGGDSSGLFERCQPLMNPLILVSALRSRSGLMTRRAER